MGKSKNYVLDAHIGDSFDKVSKKAKAIALGLHNPDGSRQNVEFEFNGVICVVSKDTDLELLYRDYCNAHTMDWKTVGADCVAEYSDEVKKELEKRERIAEKKAEAEAIKRQNAEDEQKSDFMDKTRNIEMEFSDKKAWDKGKKINSDGYGGAIYEYAEFWAKLMQVEMSKGKSLKDIAEKTSFELGFLGITGFMYGASVQILSQCWKHGEELRKWHNKEYGHEGDGVVNPAVLTISKD